MVSVRSFQLAGIAIGIVSLVGCGGAGGDLGGQAASGGAAGAGSSGGAGAVGSGGAEAPSGNGGRSGTSGAVGGGRPGGSGGSGSGGFGSGGSSPRGGSSGTGNSSTGGAGGSGGTSGRGGNSGSSGTGTGGSGAGGAQNGGTGGRISATGIERWGLFEVTLTGPSSGNPYVDVSVSATFTQGGASVLVPGFWDGGGTYRIRFSPPTTGDWSYRTNSATPELNEKTGTFRASDPTGGNHGPVESFATYYLHYADGSRYHQFGTTAYAWVHQTDALQEQTLQTLATAPFNKIRFTVFPKSYAYNHNDPQYYAFLKNASGGFDYSKPDPVFWRNFEKRVADLLKLGIQADIILWHPYDRWGFSSMGDTADDRYLRYCIARLSGYRNVWWSLANEFDLLKAKDMGDWDRFFSILQMEDPHHRMRGIHNLSVIYDHTKPWVTHASMQAWDPGNGEKYRQKYHKPIIFDECQYEGSIPEGFGHLTGQQMLDRFLQGTFTGIYVGHGETYKDPNDVLWWSKGGALKGESPKRIQFLKDIMAAAPAFDELTPAGNFTLAKESEYYLVYCQTSGSKTLQLGGTRPYKVERIDLWDMTVTSVGTTSPGSYTFSASKAALAYRFTP